jgi:hypothetical protein
MFVLTARGRPGACEELAPPVAGRAYNPSPRPRRQRVRCEVRVPGPERRWCAEGSRVIAITVEAREAPPTMPRFQRQLLATNGGIANNLFYAGPMRHRESEAFSRQTPACASRPRAALPDSRHRRAPSVPFRAVNHGQQRAHHAPPQGPPSARFAWSSGKSSRPTPLIPKLRARVRFSSPAPRISPRSAAWGLFIV